MQGINYSATLWGFETFQKIGHFNLAQLHIPRLQCGIRLIMDTEKMVGAEGFEPPTYSV